MNGKATWLALLAALLGAGALHGYLSRYELEVAGGAPRSVVIVTRDLALGQVLSRASLDFRELPERYLEERHIEARDVERVLGTRAVTAVASGCALLWSDLDVSVEKRTLAGLVRQGMRAYALPTDDIDFDGLLRPGDRVDVLLSRAELGTRTLLQSVLVLTVGPDLGGDERAEESARARQRSRVTLSVSIEQAQLLAQSEGRGTLRLALRNPQDLVLLDVPVASTGAALAEPTSVDEAAMQLSRSTP